MFQYPVGVVRSQTNLSALYGLSSFWNTYFANAQLYTDVLGAQTNLMGRLYVRLLQEMSPVSLSGTNVNLQQEVQLETFPVGGPYTLSTNVTTCKYLVDRPVLPRLVLENNVDFTIQNGSIIWANPENVSGYPFALQTGSSGTQIAVWLVDAQLDEGWLYKYYGNLLEVPYQPSSETYSQFLQGVLYMQVNGPIVDVLTAGLQITLGLPLALYDEVVLSTATLEGQYVVVTDRTSYSINAALGFSIAIGTQLTTGEPLFPQAGAIVDWQVKDKWWINLVIPEQIMPNPPQEPLCLPGNWADDIVETYLKTHSFEVRLGVSVAQVQEFVNILRNIIPTYTYPWVFSVSTLNEALVLTDPLDVTLGLGNCERFPQVDLFTRDNYQYTRGCPLFNRYTIPEGLNNRDLGGSTLTQSFSGQVTYMPRAQFSTTPRERSYVNAVMGNRNMAMPRQRSSWWRGRNSGAQSVNPWPTLVPMFMANEDYITQYATPSGFSTTVPAGTIPFPTSYQFMDWKYKNVQQNFVDIPNPPAGSQQIIFNLNLNTYAVCLIPAAATITQLLPYLKFGDTVSSMDSLAISGTIPLTRGMASVFGNPWFFGSGFTGEYYDSLNAPVNINRSGGFTLISQSN